MSSAHDSKNQHVKVTIVHVGVFAAILVCLTLVFYNYVIPVGIKGFVVPLFQPSGEALTKKPFCKFNGLVLATVKKEWTEKHGLPGVGEISYKGEIEKDALDYEYIFDFSFIQRNNDSEDKLKKTREQHGYIKTNGEFYVKSPALSESFAIILEPIKAFSILGLVLGGVFAFLITLILPSSIGLMSALFEDQIDHVMVKIRLQTGFADDIVNVLTLPDNKLRDIDRHEVEAVFEKVWERTSTDVEAKYRISFDDIWTEETDVVLFRNEAIYIRIKEFFSEFVLSEIADTRDGRAWKNNHFLISAGLRLYLAHHFSEKYSNNVTGLAYAGAAVLIIAVGVRGLKFIPANRPSYIFFAILLEFTLLSLMAITIFYTEEEERMDKMLKKMEDANRSQLETLRDQQVDIHQLSTALIGQTSEVIKHRIEAAISEYLSSPDQVHQQVARAIADKILINVRETPTAGAVKARRK